MGRSRETGSTCRIPVRSQRISFSPMKHHTGSPSSHNRLRSPTPSSPPAALRKHSGRYNHDRQVDSINYKQPTARFSQPLETAYLPPRGSNRQQNPSFEKDFGIFGTIQQQQYRRCNANSNVNNDSEDINSMFRMPEYDTPLNRSERLAGSFRIMEAARNTTPVKSGDYSVAKHWDAGLKQDGEKDNNDNILLQSPLPPPNQPIVGGNINNGTSNSRRSLNRSEDLDRILAKYGKASKSNVNTDKDPEFASVVRTDTTLRMTTDRYCKPGINPGPGIHPYWEQSGNQYQQKHGENDILLKLNNGMRGQSSVENLQEQLFEQAGPVVAPVNQLDKEINLYPNTPAQQNYNSLENISQKKSHPPAALRRSTHVFPFKETPSGHLVIDPLQIAFESRKISVLVSDPNNNTATVEFTTTKCGTNGLLFQPSSNSSFTNKNERILYEVKKAMSIQETNEAGRHSNSKLPNHQQLKELDHKKYSESTKATTEFEEKVLSRIVSGKNADTHVIIGDNIFPCHAVALEVFSSYFDRMSRSPETIQRIHLPETEVCPKAFPVLMDWIVQSENSRREILKNENLVSVYTAAKHLGMKDLEFQCISFLEKKVDSSDPDLLSMWEDVKKRQSSCLELVRIISGKLAASYHEIFKSKRFMQMEVDELYMLLSSDDISIDSEMDVYDSAVAWLLHDWKNRKIYTNKIMSTVRFGLLSPLQLTQINLCPEINKVKSEKDYNQIMTYGTVKSMIDEGLSYSILDDSYKNQPEELKKWMDKTRVKAPAPRICLVNKKRGSPFIREKISLLEDASQTKLRASFSKIPEKSSSYTLLDGATRPGTPYVDPSSQNYTDSVHISNPTNNNEGGSVNNKDQRGKSRIPKPPGTGSGGAGGSSIGHHGSNLVVQELSRPKLMSNSSNTLQQVTSDTNEEIVLPYTDSDIYTPADLYISHDHRQKYNSVN